MTHDNWLDEAMRLHYEAAMKASTYVRSINRKNLKAATGARDALRVHLSARADDWKTAVIDALVINHIYTAEHDNDPRKALADLIAWETMIALDPAVSPEALALIERGRTEGEAAIALLRRALAESLRLQSHYAMLLNMQDGGQRMRFDSVDAWLERLALLADKAGEPEQPK